jgi:cyclase
LKTKRIIPCLDVKDGRVVKGVNFVGLKDVGDICELAALYDTEGADELILLDISASREARKTFVDVVERTKDRVSIPLTVGGGIANVNDMQTVLQAGADKVSINTAAINDPDLISRGANLFGSKSIVVAVDARNVGPNNWRVFTYGGMKDTGVDALEWVQRVEELGAGEILLTSMDKDGTKDGFDNELTKRVSESVSIPVIASGGAGTLDHFCDVFLKGKADAALAASIFHSRTLTIKQVKEYLREKGVAVAI